MFFYLLSDVKLKQLRLKTLCTIKEKKSCIFVSEGGRKVQLLSSKGFSMHLTDQKL